MEPVPEIVRPTEFYVIPFHDDEIHITVTSEYDAVVRWISEIEHPSLYTVGVNVMLRYYRGFSRVATLQLCVGSRSLIYLLEFVDYDFPGVLLDFLKNEEYTFVGWDIHLVSLRLEMETGLDIPRTIRVGLHDLAEFRFLDNTDMSGYIFVDGCAEWNESVEMILGREVEEIPEEVLRLSLDEQLTAEQVKYASIDVFVAFEIARILNARSFRLLDEF